ncbi:MAG: NAD(P)H-binding protein [Planctomycetota bacterium]
MKFAITGGTGFVGGALATTLSQAGHEVVSISRRTGLDVQNKPGLVAAFQGCDAIAHCAGINRELRGQRYRDVHIQGTQNVVDAAMEAGVRRIAMVSFLRARPNCGSRYHESKWAAEEIIRKSGLDYAILKAGVIYGKGDHMLDHLSRALFTFPVFGLVGFKAQPVRPTGVADVAHILKAALTETRLRNATVAVVGPEEMSLGDAVQRVGSTLGKNPLYVRLPLAFHYALAWGLERTMKVPMVALAQVRILSESLVEPFVGETGVEELPPDLVPTQPFNTESIRRGLPDPGGFGLRDLALTACP